ncbi:HepT-like ribonuclease domain-containing protein [Bradyrhizobium sp. 200]
MNDFANLLRHAAYHNTKVEIVWDIIRNHLPLLKAFVEVQIDSRGK